MTIREVLINIRERLQNAGIEDLNMKAGHFLTGNFISTELNFI